jgi:F-type H+-transporting ATPase subunit b
LNLKFRSPKFLLLGLILTAGLSLPTANAQNASAPTANAQAAGGVSNPEKMDAPETKSETEGFRHAAPVRAIAHKLNLDTELVAKIFEDLNSLILIGGILWFLLRLMPKVLRNRSETLQKQLLEARLATTQANERLSVVEERLSKLGIEIDAIREQTEREIANDEKRIKETLEVERERIVASAEQDIDAAGAAVRRDLKKFAAELAIDRALHGIHLSAEDDQTLIHTFADGLKGERN